MIIQNHTLIKIKKSDILNGSCTVPDGITSIGDYAFRGCETLKSIILPDSITSIGNYTFEWCINLKSIILPDGLTSIGNGVFYRCETLESVILPDSITCGRRHYNGGSFFPHSARTRPYRAVFYKSYV